MASSNRTVVALTTEYELTCIPENTGTAPTLLCSAELRISRLEQNQHMATQRVKPSSHEWSASLRDFFLIIKNGTFKSNAGYGDINGHFLLRTVHAMLEENVSEAHKKHV